MFCPLSCLQAARHVNRLAVAIALHFDAMSVVPEAGEPAVEMLQCEQIIDDGALFRRDSLAPAS